MTDMHEEEFKIKAPYDFRLSLKFSHDCRFEDPDHGRSASLKRLICLNGSSFYVEIRIRGGVDRPAGIVKWKDLGSKPAERREVVNAARRIIQADLDLRPFYQICKRFSPFHRLTEKYRGLKLILTSTPFEALAWAIMGQQVNLRFAYTLKRRLEEKYGADFEHNGRKYLSFPPPAGLSRVRPATLRKMQFSQRKADCLIGMARTVRRDRDFFDAIEKLSYGDAVSRLMSHRGLGPWSANYILMRGTGHSDCLPLGDSGLRRAIKRFYGLKSDPEAARIEELAEDYRPYRSLFTLYLWFNLMEEQSNEKQGVYS
jgi:DNA-3-methyladenine glycosylase II